jgi:hypothetical protein
MDSVVMLAALVCAAPRPALADVTKAECIGANTKAQDMRRAGKFSSAREELRRCADPACPAIVRDDCIKRLDEIDRVQPTLVFDVQDAAGRDVIAVRVTVDGALLTDRLSGASVPIDPGEHVFTFEAEGHPPVQRTLLVKENDKDRKEHIVVGAASAGPLVATPPPAPAVGPKPSAPETTAPPAPPAESRSSSAPRASASGAKTAAFVVSGAGVVGLAVGGIFGALSFAKWGSAQSECLSATSCTSHPLAVSDRSDAVTDATVSTVAFVAGGVALAAGATLFFVARSGSAVAIAPSVGPGGSGMVVKGAF